MDLRTDEGVFGITSVILPAKEPLRFILSPYLRHRIKLTLHGNPAVRATCVATLKYKGETTVKKVVILDKHGEYELTLTMHWENREITFN